MNSGDSKHIVALLERIGRLITTDGHAEGLKPVQWEALRYLAKANRFSNTAAAVTVYLGLTKGTVSQSLMALEVKGLIRKEADARDRRSTRLALTPKARRLLGNDPLIETEAAVDSLPQSTRKQLDKGLGSLVSRLLAARDRQPFGQCHDCRFFARNHVDGGPHRCQLIEEKLSDEDSHLICVEQSPRRAVAGA